MTDTSFWIQYNPNISLEHTAKKFYGKYLYKLVVYAPAGRLILTSGDIKSELAYRQNFNYNHGGSWWVRKNNATLNNVNVSLLTSLRELKNANLPDIKIRVEEPRLQIYATSEQSLKDIVNQYISVGPASYVETFSGPADDDAETILNSGAIIRKSDIGYKYKISLRDGTYTQDIKNSVLSYLQNLGPDQVRVPRSTFDMLTRPSSYIWGCYLYANEMSVTTFLQLISPGIVGNYHELVIVPHK